MGVLHRLDGLDRRVSRLIERRRGPRSGRTSDTLVTTSAMTASDTTGATGAAGLLVAFAVALRRRR